jgi:hypothetical protein
MCYEFRNPEEAVIPLGVRVTFYSKKICWQTRSSVPPHPSSNNLAKSGIFPTRFWGGLNQAFSTVGLDVIISEGVLERK